MLRFQELSESLTIKPLPSDVDEHKTVTDFMSGGCGCKKGHGGKQCCIQFSTEYVAAIRNSCAKLSSSELDMVILGQLSAFTNKSESVVTTSGHAAHKHEEQYTSLSHQTKPVCIKMFRIMHGIGERRFKNLEKSLKENGLTPRIHGNAKKQPHHALPLSSVENVKRFIHSYTEQNGLLLPERVPGHSHTHIQLLPSSVSKRDVWKIYNEAAADDGTIHTVAYSTFCKLWKQFVPSVLTMTPTSDLCWQCQENSSTIFRKANCSVSEKTAALRVAQEHVRVAQLEQSFYRTTCDDCKSQNLPHFSSIGHFTPPSPLTTALSPPCLTKTHYSFSCPQQVHYPSDPSKPGPVYFLTPRKCSVFDINCEAIPRQINFLTDEAGECSKRANSVISRLHYFFDHHSLGEREVFLHSDNCTAQNNTLLQYLAWRTLTNKHTAVTLSCFVAGHNKFSPTWCFGLIKRLYRKTKVGSLRDVVNVVNKSADCNFAQLVSQEDGSTIVPTYDWASFFAAHFRELPSITNFHHFRFSSSFPGVVYYKEHADSLEVSFNLLKPSWTPSEQEMPDIIQSNGLSAERQWYLFDHIRQYCPDEYKDITCPRPVAPKPCCQGTSDAEKVDTTTFCPPKRQHTSARV